MKAWILVGTYSSKTAFGFNVVMRPRSHLPILLILLSVGCIDRINMDVELPEAYPVVIDGYISDRPGPYTVIVSKAFDIESKSSLRVRIAVKQLVLSDDIGNSEELQQVSQGIYQTRPNGIRGAIGRVYKLKIALLDGRVYESKPDTLLASGSVDSVYFQYKSEKTTEGATRYGFDIYFDASAGGRSNYRFLWGFNGTYKVDITCCSCWANIRNKDPMVSDNQLVQAGEFKDVMAGYVPITGWTFMYKVHAEVDQMSLSRQSFEFWKAVKLQKDAAGSLFQPITGKIPSNFKQISGEETEMQGLFFATSIASRAIYITRNDIPDQKAIPKLQLAPPTANHDPADNTCQGLFPNSTTERPSFWVD